jgi:hypothetical protein
MKLEEGGSDIIRIGSPAKKSSSLYKNLIEAKLREIKAIRIAYSR